MIDTIIKIDPFLTANQERIVEKREEKRRLADIRVSRLKFFREQNTVIMREKQQNRKNTKLPAGCHPDKKERCKGLCEKCYRQYLYKAKWKRALEDELAIVKVKAAEKCPEGLDQHAWDKITASYEVQIPELEKMLAASVHDLRNLLFTR